MSDVHNWAKNWRLMRTASLVGLLTAFTLIMAACQESAPAAPAAEATATPTAEAAAEPATEAPTEAPAEEATEAPAEEATVEPAEEATEAPAEEATAEPAEEAAPAAEAMAGDAANGAYIALMTGGCGCHMNRDLGGLAGGNEFETPTGKVYAANITPDNETGIGQLSDETLISLLRTGQEVEEGGEVEVIHPVMPYRTFSILSDKDAQDIVAWLRSLEPLSNAVPARELTEEPQPWTPETAPPAEAPTEPVARGEYLVTLANCGGCHTPKNEDGSPLADMFLAGAPLREEFAANITPDEATGIGSWTEEQIAHFMLTGMEPDGSMVEGAMAQQIERRFSKLTEADAAAIAAYLKSIPAVANAAPQ